MIKILAKYYVLLNRDRKQWESLPEPPGAISPPTFPSGSKSSWMPRSGALVTLRLLGHSAGPSISNANGKIWKILWLITLKRYYCEFEKVVILLFQYKITNEHNIGLPLFVSFFRHITFLISRLICSSVMCICERICDSQSANTRSGPSMSRSILFAPFLETVNDRIMLPSRTSSKMTS